MKSKTKTKTSIKTNTKVKTKKTVKVNAKKQIHQKNERIPTLQGTIIIIIMSITAGLFVWVATKDDLKAMQFQYNNPTRKVTKTSQTSKQQNNSHQNDESLSWQTYQDEKLGFKFQYPKTWTFNAQTSTFTPNPQENCGPNIAGETAKLMCLDNISFEIIENNDDLILTDFWKKEYRWENEIHYKDLKEYKLGENIAYTVTTINGYDGAEDKAFWVPLKGKLFNLRGSYLNEKENIIFDKIISTFKFID